MDLLRGMVNGADHSRPAMTPEQRRLWEEQSRIKEMLVRLDRIDATLPRARYHQVYPHPHRRAGD